MTVRKADPTATTPDIIDFDTFKVQHLRVDSTYENTLIAEMLNAAIDHLEGPVGYLAGRSLINTEWIEDIPRPCQEEIKLKMATLVSIASITYEDLDGNTQTLASTAYSYRISPIGEGFVTCKDWPQMAEGESLHIRYTAGYGDAADDIPAAIRMAIMIHAAHMYRNRETGSQVRVREVPYLYKPLVSRHRRPSH